MMMATSKMSMTEITVRCGQVPATVTRDLSERHWCTRAPRNCNAASERFNAGLEQGSQIRARCSQAVSGHDLQPCRTPPINIDGTPQGRVPIPSRHGKTGPCAPRLAQNAQLTPHTE